MYEHELINDYNCRNPCLRLTTKARACKGADQKSKPGSHISCFKECKRV